jgi:hypothetical protein
MSERDDKCGGSGCLIAAAVLIFSLPPLYVLGIGPAAWLDSHVSFPVSLLKTVYAPLVFVAENCEPIGEALDWYAELWF